MLEKLHTNQKLFISELQKRGATVEILNLEEELVEVHFKNNKEFLWDRFTSRMPYHLVRLSADKHLAKQLMSKVGINVPLGAVFTSEYMNEAIDYATTIFPVVLKPNWGSHGDGVVADIKDAQALENTILDYKKSHGLKKPFIIEQFFEGTEHRLFITSLGGFAAIKRERAKVIGNGKHSIFSLVQIENEKRKDMKKKSYTSLCPLVLDEEVTRHLLQNYHITSLDYTPKDNEVIYLRNQSNLAKGGVSYDVTHCAHESVLHIAKKALLSFPTMPVAGFDLMCKDITQPLSQKNYVILEANSNPGLTMHMHPVVGKAQNVASLLADVMFPNFFN